MFYFWSLVDHIIAYRQLNCWPNVDQLSLKGSIFILFYPYAESSFLLYNCNPNQKGCALDALDFCLVLSYSSIFLARIQLQWKCMLQGKKKGRKWGDRKKYIRNKTLVICISQLWRYWRRMITVSCPRRALGKAPPYCRNLDLNNV